MPKKIQKSVSFDAVLKSFIKHYNLPTKKDIDKFTDQMDRLEKLIRKTNSSLTLSGKASLSKGSGHLREKTTGKSTATASSMVLDVISGSKKGADFKTIQDKTGFDEKKIRNIIFRLNKIGKITRKNRGTYIAIN
ncbi:MAG: hypothetical protein KJ737_13660 [Proteobacteria bacterium]|nr:hypothetical protein [Pseudomonadota bacterium]